MSKTIFMIHGMWGGGWYWDKYQKYFTNKGYKCLAPNLRHHDVEPDDSPPPELGATSLLDYAYDLEVEIKKLDEKPIIMGHSMGGLLAQILASRGLAKKAILVTPAPPAGIVALSWSVIKSFQDVLLSWGFWKKTHIFSYEKAVYSTMEKLPEEERRYIYNKCVSESGRAIAEIAFWYLGLKGAQVDSKTVTCPLLVIAGSEDRITPAKIVKKVAEKYKPIHTYMEFGGHAHWIIREPGWEKVASCIAAWLEETPS